MMSRTFLCSGLLGVALAVGSALGQSTPAITMDKVMSGEELRATGIATLTPAQRAVLDHWLSEYTVKVVQIAQGTNKPASSSPSSYAGSSGGHWIKSKADNGGIIILEDGSMWEINSFDHIYTALWLPITNVTILKSSSPVGDFKYTLLNTDDGEKALAKFLGKQ
jgi:hypothetical protein